VAPQVAATGTPASRSARRRRTPLRPPVSHMSAPGRMSSSLFAWRRPDAPIHR